MKLDLAGQVSSLMKKEKIYLALSIVFGVLFVVSFTLFLVFANYHIELLMKIVGSVVNSVLAVLFAASILGLLLPTIQTRKFYQKVLQNEERECRGIIRLESERHTVEKGITLSKVSLGDEEFFLLDQSIPLREGEATYYFRGHLIVGVSDE